MSDGGTTRDPDSLPTSGDPNGPCPRCGRVSSFEFQGAAGVTFTGGMLHGGGGAVERDFDQQVVILECRGCRDRIVVIEEEQLDGQPKRSASPMRGGTISWAGINWWPTPGATTTDDVPIDISSAYAEGMRALSANAPNGAVALFRTALAYIVRRNGSPEAQTKRDLKDQLEQMAREGTLPPSLADWTTHVRLYGNAGAHPDIFGDVTVDEAKDVARLVGSLLEVLYVVPANIGRRQAERTRPKGDPE